LVDLREEPDLVRFREDPDRVDRSEPLDFREIFFLEDVRLRDVFFVGRVAMSKSSFKSSSSLLLSPNNNVDLI